MVLSIALVAWAIFLFSGVGVSVVHVPANNSAHELLNGRDDSSSLLLPLGLFVAGIVGLATCLK